MEACNCQQFQLYAAEAAVPRGRTFATEEELQAFVDGMRDTPYFERNFPQVIRIEAYVRTDRRVTSSVGSWKPESNAGLIEMLPCHMHELIVLHECSHVLAQARYGSRSHDPWFARTYLELVFTHMGPEAYVALKDALDTGGVDHDTDNSVPGGLQV